MMKNPVTVAAVIGMLGVTPLIAAPHQDKKAPQQEEKAAKGQMCLLKVSGMACGACASAVEKAAKRIEGVTSAKVSQPKGTAEITYDPAKTTPEAIAKAISAGTLFKAEATRPGR